MSVNLNIMYCIRFDVKQNVQVQSYTTNLTPIHLVCLRVNYKISLHLMRLVLVKLLHVFYLFIFFSASHGLVSFLRFFTSIFFIGPSCAACCVCVAAPQEPSNIPEASFQSASMKRAPFSSDVEQEEMQRKNMFSHQVTLHIVI